MRVLITGGLGFIGAAVAERYVQLGWDVFIVDDRSGNVRDDVPGAVVHAGPHWDVRTAPLGQYLPRRFDVVVHAASPVGAVGVLDRAGFITRDIVEATHWTANFAVTTGARLINISSSEVYGYTGRYHEDSTLVVNPGYNARREYAVGKAAAEMMLAGRRQPVVSIRPFNVVGPGQPSSKGFVLPTFCEQAAMGVPLTVFHPGDQRRAFTSVWDVAEFITGPYLDNAEWEGEPINVGNPGNETTIVDLARWVLLAAGRPDTHWRITTGQFVHGPDYAEADGHDKLPAIDRARRLGWEPQDTIRAIVNRTYAEVADAVVV